VPLQVEALVDDLASAWRRAVSCCGRRRQRCRQRATTAFSPALSELLRQPAAGARERARTGCGCASSARSVTASSGSRWCIRATASSPLDEPMSTAAVADPGLSDHRRAGQGLRKLIARAMRGRSRRACSTPTGARRIAACPLPAALGLLHSPPPELAAATRCRVAAIRPGGESSSTSCWRSSCRCAVPTWRAGQGRAGAAAAGRWPRVCWRYCPLR
jgi:hypothetical protein